MTTAHKEGEFLTDDNIGLRFQAWIPEAPEFFVIYLHGAAAHSGEALNYASYITKHANGAVFSFDQRGWGKSSDRKAGHISSGDDVIQDVMAFVEFIRTEYNNLSDLSMVLAGHSMGGLIALRVLIDYQDHFTCATISCPWIATRVNVPFYIQIFSGLLSAIWPTFSDSLNLKVDELTHDNKIISQYYKEIDDGLRRTHGTARWYTEMTKIQKFVFENANQITLPTLIMQAGQDLIVKEAASKDIYNSLGCDSEDKSWQYYPNLYHELWNEEDRETKTLPVTKAFIERYAK